MKKLLGMVFWWFRIFIRMLYMFTCYVGTFLGVLHAAFAVAEYKFKGWKIVHFDKKKMMMVLDQKDDSVLLDLAGGQIYEGKKKQAASETCADDGCSDGTANKRDDGTQ